jgi:hypothetical protein
MSEIATFTIVDPEGKETVAALEKGNDITDQQWQEFLGEAAEHYSVTDREFEDWKASQIAEFEALARGETYLP